MKEQLILENFVLGNYLPILIFAILAIGLGTVVVVLPFIVAKRFYYNTKNKPYECGFDAFQDMQRKFDVRFYLISILFIIFDLEIAFLFPWAITVKEVGWISFGSMFVFLIVLTVGFVYEWMRGALEWE